MDVGSGGTSGGGVVMEGGRGRREGDGERPLEEICKRRMGGECMEGGREECRKTRSK